MTKTIPLKTVASACRDLIAVYLATSLSILDINLWNCAGAECYMHQQYFLKPLLHYATTICTTGANRPEKKDQMLKL